MEQIEDEQWWVVSNLPLEKSRVALKLMRKMKRYILEGKCEWKYNFDFVVFAIINRIVRDHGDFSLKPDEIYGIYCLEYEKACCNEDIADKEAEACAATADRMVHILDKQ